MTRSWGGSNLDMKIPQSRMEDLIEKSESNATYKYDNFNNSQNLRQENFSLCIFQNLKCIIQP